ncbi:aminotransferase class V-fold PLP-dependent enzyme [Actinocorallia sp. B10E7]|uniref:aminotransferase class V-fold PLP-dependent enzyme n=1 Tax=Actinocorallia sp. B10E7 TaxID=3153558 RepID=UPI00325D0873
MKPSAQDDFFLAPDLVLLNHASYGLASRLVTSHADRIRQQIESDPTFFLGSHLTEHLRQATQTAAAALNLAPENTALCPNATSGAAALISSLPLAEDSVVVALETEYSSILRAWEVACTRVGATMIRVPVQLPFEGPDQLLFSLEALVPGPVTYLQMSLVSSSSAIHFPVTDIADWVHRRGGRLLLDAAHGPGHVPLEPLFWGVDAVFGTLHKWFPTLRPVGFLWLHESLAPHIKPAEISLSWDSSDLIERFSWPGTFDPVPRLSLDTAVKQWRSWHEQKLIEQCQELADHAVDLLTSVGARPTAAPSHLPPRLRGFVIDGLSVADVKGLLQEAGVRTWVGPGTAGECILRLSTHIYNDASDVETVAAQLKEALS